MSLLHSSFALSDVRTVTGNVSRESVAEMVAGWLGEREVIAGFIEKGSPPQKCYVERLNGSMRDELLDREEFDSLLKARIVNSQWLEHYNNGRPHSGLGTKMPAAFAREVRLRLTTSRIDGDE